MTSFSALAAAPGAQERAQIHQTYRAERGACLDGSSTQEKNACLNEATAARGEALRGELGQQTVGRNESALPVEEDLFANSLSRCDGVPADVRGVCDRRVLSDDVIIVGSVAEGGIIRELRASEPVTVGQTEMDLPVIVAEATEPLMEAPPASERVDGIDGTPVRSADNQIWAGAEVGIPETSFSSAKLFEPVTEPQSAQSAQSMQEVQEVQGFEGLQGSQELQEALLAQPARDPAPAPFTSAQDPATSSLERSPYPL
jgi:hypothetical protein